MPRPESKLDRRVQDLIRLVCNIQAMEEALLEMKFDARKNPLGTDDEVHLLLSSPSSELSLQVN